MLTGSSRGMILFTVVIWSISGTRSYDTILSSELVVHHSVTSTKQWANKRSNLSFEVRPLTVETGYQTALPSVNNCDFIYLNQLCKFFVTNMSFSPTCVLLVSRVLDRSHTLLASAYKLMHSMQTIFYICLVHTTRVLSSASLNLLGLSSLSLSSRLKFRWKRGSLHKVA